MLLVGQLRCSSFLYINIFYYVQPYISDLYVEYLWLMEKRVNDRSIHDRLKRSLVLLHVLFSEFLQVKIILLILADRNFDSVFGSTTTCGESVIITILMLSTYVIFSFLLIRNMSCILFQINYIR